MVLASVILFPFIHSVARLELAIAEPHPKVLNLASIILSCSSTVNFEKSKYENGQLRYKVNYKDGKLDGLWEYFNEDGSLKKTDTYKNGLKQK